MIDAQWLFENHLNHLALEKYLLARMEQIIRPNDRSNDEEISGQILSRPPLGIRPQRNYQGSSTERIVLLLQGNEIEQPKELIREYEQLLSYCKLLIELYDTILVSLTTKEAWLVDAIYHHGWTMETIQRMPDTPYGTCDRSTIYRTKYRIIKKANIFIQTYLPKEVSKCRLETFISELNQLQDRSIMS